jgi:hypothetical protein
MLNERGQAFDAFKLLIAAVVAGAILVILLGIIRTIIPVGQDPITIMGQELTKVKEGGVGTVSTTTVEFNPGTDISANAVARAAGINDGDVKFCNGWDYGGGTWSCTGPTTAGCGSHGTESVCDNHASDGCSWTLPTCPDVPCDGYEFTAVSAFGGDADKLTVSSTIGGRIRAWCPIGTECDGKCIIGFQSSR